MVPGVYVTTGITYGYSLPGPVVIIDHDELVFVLSGDLSVQLIMVWCNGMIVYVSPLKAAEWRRVGDGA